MVRGWIDIHLELGCLDCRFCDLECYGLDACCTHFAPVEIEDETGKCLSKIRKVNKEDKS